MDLLALLIFNSGILLLFFLWLRRRVDRELSADRAIDTVRKEIGTLISELNQTTERNITLIEDRVQRLKSVLEHTERKMTVLKRETEAHDRSVETYQALGRSSGERSEPADVAPATPDSRMPSPELERNDTPPLPDESRTGGSRSALRTRVNDLHSHGVSVEEISRRVDVTIGEVELMISLDNIRRG